MTADTRPLDPTVLLHYLIIPPLQNDLIDFTLSTSRIWSVWRGKDGECEVYSASLQTSSHWIPVIIESIPDAGQPPNVDGETDPRQIYLQHIFHPGRFPLHIISKALNVMSTSLSL
jgi:nuclear pore complex protein Nup160